MMTHVLLGVLFVLLCSTQVACQCEPVEEGRSFTLPCGGGACNSSALTTWTAQDVGDGSNRLISTCDTTLNCTGNNEFFTIKIARNGEGYQSNLTIHKVSLSQPFNNERNWRCNYCGTELGTCSLIIYVKAVNPKCQASEILDDRGDVSQINLTCTAERVYPQGKCLFQTKAQDGSVIQLPQLLGTSCSNIIDVANFHDGVNEVQAKVGSDRQPDFDLIQPIPVLPFIRLKLPKTMLACGTIPYKDGFYKGETVNCTCRLTERGRPEGRPQWYRNGVAFLTPPESYVSSSFNNRDEIACAGLSAIGRETPGNVIRIAHLQPGAINLTTDDGGIPVDICCDRPGVSVICEIGTSQVNPSPNIGLLVSSSLASNLQAGTYLRHVYRREFKFRPKIGGIYRVGCMVENSIFPDLSEDKTINITIYSPVEFEDPAKMKREYRVRIDPKSPVTISAEITGFPSAQTFILYKGNPDVNVTVNNSTYDFEFIERSPSAGTAMVTLTIHTDSDLTSYTLVMGNGIGDELHYVFTLKEVTDDLKLIPLIVGIVAGVVLIVVIAGVVCWRLRRKRSQADDGNNNDYEDMEDPYSNPDENESKKENKDAECEEDVEYEEPTNNPPDGTTQIPQQTKKYKSNASKTKTSNKSKKTISKSATKKKKSFTAKESTKQQKNKEKEIKEKNHENEGTSSVSIVMGDMGPDYDNPDLEIPPPRPPPRNAPIVEESVYVNFSPQDLVAAGTEYGVAESLNEEAEYLEVETCNNTVSSTQSADNEANDYYSSIDAAGKL